MMFAHALLLASLAAAPAPEPVVLSAVKPSPLAQHLSPEQPTVFVFLRPTSTMEKALIGDLRRTAGTKVGFREIHLKTGDEPLAAQYGVRETPTALVYDRRGRFIGRSTDASRIAEMVSKAAQVMRIDWAQPGDPRLAEAETILGRPAPPGLFRTMTLRPEYLKPIFELHGLRQADSTLDRRTRELVSTYVSALNRCKFCVSAHAHNLMTQGQDPKDVDQIGTGAPEKAALTYKERVLLEYIRVLTLEPAKVRDTHVDRLRKAGWTEQQIFEATFEASFMAFNNRMSTAWGLDYNSSRWLPPSLRAPGLD